jgi:hypothetical protein
LIRTPIELIETSIKATKQEMVKASNDDFLNAASTQATTPGDVVLFSGYRRGRRVVRGYKLHRPGIGIYFPVNFICAD